MYLHSIGESEREVVKVFEKGDENPTRVPPRTNYRTIKKEGQDPSKSGSDPLIY